MPTLKDYRWFQENYPVDIPAETGPAEISVEGGGGAYLARPEEISPEESVEMAQWMAPGGIDRQIAEMREETARYQEERAEYRAETARIWAKVAEKRGYPKKPPVGYQLTDRERYEQSVFAEIEKLFRIPSRGNPFKVSTTDAVEEFMATGLPKLFNEVFQGQYRFADADKLPPKALAFWNDAVLRAKAEVAEKADYAIKRAQSYHKHAMSDYDTKRAKVEGAAEKRAKEIQRLREKEGRWMLNPQGEFTWHKMDEITGDYVDTGKKKEKPPTETLTIYPSEGKGKGKRVTVAKIEGKEYRPPEGWTLDKPEKGKPRAEEKHKIAKAVSASGYRTALTGNERDESIFQANARLYNISNERNEIAYWQTLGREKTKIVKLTLEAIKDGWTPEKVQAAAEAKVITLEQVLGELGIIKLPIELMQPAYKRLPIPKE